MTHLINNDEDEPVLQRVNTISNDSSNNKSEDKEEDQGNSEDEADIIETVSVKDNNEPEVVPSLETTINETVAQAMRDLDTLLANSIVKEASERITRSANTETGRDSSSSKACKFAMAASKNESITQRYIEQGNFQELEDEKVTNYL